MKNNMFWAVYDILNDDIVGFWSDISDAEEFLQENQAPEDLWSVMPTDELTCGITPV